MMDRQATEMDPRNAAAIRRHLKTVVAESSTAQTVWWRRPQMVLLAVVLGGGTASVAAFSLIPDRPVTSTSLVECRTSLDAAAVGQFVSQPAATGTGSSRTLDAIEACSSGWRLGLYQLDREYQSPDSSWNPQAEPDHAIPPLSVCVADDGHAVTIPADSSQACWPLDMAALTE